MVAVLECAPRCRCCGATRWASAVPSLVLVVLVDLAGWFRSRRSVMIGRGVACPLSGGYPLPLRALGVLVYRV